MRAKVAIPLVIALFIIAIAGYWFGASRSHAELGPAVAYTQAQLAFGHHKFYERIESLLERKCYEAAMTEARELKKLQLVLISDNLSRAGNDHELIEYMKLRDSKVVEIVLSGKLPELKTYTTTCP